MERIETSIEGVSTQPYQGRLVVMSCGECGITFGVPDSFYRQCRREGKAKFWYCPNGHCRHFTETLEGRLTIELERARRDNAYNREALATARKSQSALRGVVTRERNRLARGLCPRCNREFPDVAKHMALLHAGFEAEDPEANDDPATA